VEDGNNTFLKEGTVLDPKAAQEAIHLLETAQAEADLESAVRVRDAMERQLAHSWARVRREARRYQDQVARGAV